MRIATIIMGLIFSCELFAITPDQKTLPRELASWEIGRALDTNQITTPNPVGPVHSLGEWEESEAVMTLWPNQSYIKALAENGPLQILADTSSDQAWWQNWLDGKNIKPIKLGFFAVNTDSIWVRDYGPLYIVDGQGKFGIVDTIYNRPRPQDDKVPQAISKLLNIPLFAPGLIHTGGNYYSDGVGSAFSSTMVYTENSKYSMDEVRNRMFSFLGIDRYVTARLNPGISIEHMDTYGKLVAPDTFVWGEFPQGSRYKNDSENMLNQVRTLKSPYGTPYKIHRMKMYTIDGRFEVPSNERDGYRAYINSFISNKAVFLPTYGGEADQIAKTIYETALPGYKAVGVENEYTSWGDSVHCRSRNLIKRDTIFIFPKVVGTAKAGLPTTFIAEIFPSPGGTLTELPKVSIVINSVGSELRMAKTTDNNFEVEIPAQITGTKVSLSITAKDSKGIQKTIPMAAPRMMIDFTVE